MTPGFRDQLDGLGYDEAERAKGQFGVGYCQLAEAAHAIASRLLDDLQPTLVGLREELIDDLVWRGMPSIVRPLLAGRAAAQGTSHIADT